MALPVQYFQKLVESCPDIIISVDRQGMITFYNDGARQNLGFSFDEVLGKSVLEIYPNLEEARRVMTAMRASDGEGKGRIRNFETRFKTKRGEPIPVTISASACQAHGALYQERPLGTLSGERGIGALSFYPTKNLGGLGDGGAILVNDPALAAQLRKLRNGGQSDRYRHELPGVNSRLDDLQAAILRVGFKHLAAWTERRRALASFYLRELAGTGLGLPVEEPWARAVFHLFVVRHPRRDALRAALEEHGVGTLIHYPIPLHLQPAFAALGGRPGDPPAAEKAAAEILSLPLYPELTDEQAQAVVTAVRDTAKWGWE